MSLLLFLGLLASAVAGGLASCANHPNGFCISLTHDTCPSGSYVSYSGCGFLEQCCYYPEYIHEQTTHSHVLPTSHCGVPDYDMGKKIVGGSQTVIEKYPWQVSIRFWNSHLCGGSIINERWILTAAHCIKEVPQPVYARDFTIVAGSTNQQIYDDDNHYTTDYIIPHQGYLKNVKNDVALIKVSRMIDLAGRTRKPICMADVGEDYTGQVCVATGWGDLVEGTKHAVAMLREVDLPIVAHQLCTYYNGYVDDDMICAGPKYGGKDTCQGDSGGPLICQTRDGVWKQAGIVSNGNGCARPDTFGVYTEVSKFRTWIHDVMSRY